MGCPAYRSANFQLITLSQSKTTKLNNCVLVECSTAHSAPILLRQWHICRVSYSFSSIAYNYVNCTMNMQNFYLCSSDYVYIYLPWISHINVCYRNILQLYYCCRKPHHHFVLFKNKNFYSTGCTYANTIHTSLLCIMDQESMYIIFFVRNVFCTMPGQF